MFSSLTIVAGLALAAAPAPAGTVLESATPWGSYEETYRCTVERTFGAKPGGFAMRLGYSPLGHALDATFIMRTDTMPRPATSVQVTFDQGGTSITLTGRVIQFPKQKLIAVFVDRIGNDFWQSFAESKSLQLAIGDRTIASARYAGASKVSQAATDCAAKLFAKWGGVQTREGPSMQMKGVSSEYYPKAALDRGAGGRVFVFYKVGLDGRAHDCKVGRSSGNRALDSQTCVVVESRARFVPAKDEGGRPVASASGMWFNWMIDSDDYLLNDPFFGSFATNFGNNVN